MWYQKHKTTNRISHGTRNSSSVESYLSPQADFEFPNQNNILWSQLLKYLRTKALASTEPTSVSTEPSVSHAEASQSVLDL